MKLAVVVVGRGGPRWVDEGIAHYDKRLRRWGGVEPVTVRAAKFRGDVGTVRAQESDAVRKILRPRDRVVVLDERGEDLDTTAFAALIRRARNDGVGRLSFVIGGPYGHHASLREEAHRVIRLSGLVLNHDLARLVLYEQLYRVHDLLAGGPYHH